MTNPEFLRELGIPPSGIKSIVMNMLRGGLSIEKLEEDFFTSLDNVLIERLLEPVSENIVIDCSLKLEENNGKKYVRITQKRSYNLINPTERESRAFIKGIVDRVQVIMPKAFIDTEEIDKNRLYTMQEFEINNEPQKNLDCEVEVKKNEYGEVYYIACKKSEEKIASRDKKLISIKSSFVMEDTDYLLWGFKTITKGAIYNVHYDPKELYVEIMMTSPMAYPIIYPTKKVSDGFLTVRTEDVLYPGNSVVVFWKNLT